MSNFNGPSDCDDCADVAGAAEAKTSLSQPINVALIGYRGTGKSTVARLVAARLGWEWHDADAEIERRAGKSIRQIFDDEGEPVFRDWETAVVRDLAQRERCVLALGGGAVVREQNRAFLAGSIVVWLRAEPATLARRIAGDASTTDRRPNLTAHGGVEEIERLMAAREPIYHGLARHAVETEGKSPDEVADIIFRLIGEGLGPVGSS